MSTSEVISSISLFVSAVVGFIEYKRWEKEKAERTPYAILDEVETSGDSFKAVLVITNRSAREIVVNRIYAHCGYFYAICGVLTQNEYGERVGVTVNIDEYPMENTKILVQAYETRRIPIHLITEKDGIVAKASLLPVGKHYSVAIEEV